MVSGFVHLVDKIQKVDVVQATRVVGDVGFAGMALTIGWLEAVQGLLGLALTLTGIVVGALRIALMIREWRRGKISAADE